MLQSITHHVLQPLVSSRLVVRRLEESDLEALCSFMGDIEVMYAWEYAFTRKFSLWIKGGNMLDMTIQYTPLYSESGIYFTAGICLNL